MRCASRWRLNALPNDVREATSLPPAELRVLACGESILHVLPSQLVPLLDFDGFAVDSPIPGWIRDIIGSKDSFWLRTFLFFATASETLPRAPQPENIRFVAMSRSAADRLPVAHTCFNTIDMPLYPSCEELEAKLDLAISESSGFDFS